LGGEERGEVWKEGGKQRDVMEEGKQERREYIGKGEEQFGRRNDFLLTLLFTNPGYNPHL